jgi:hypothetical protein
MIKTGWKALYINYKLLSCMFELCPVDFRVYVLPIDIFGRSRHFFGFTFHRWQNPKTVSREALPKCAYLSISLFYLPDLEFRIGNGKTWLWLRNENIFAWKIRRRNEKSFKKWIANT